MVNPPSALTIVTTLIELSSSLAAFILAMQLDY